MKAGHKMITGVDVAKIKDGKARGALVIYGS
jgi:hypothetical protein